MKTKIYLFDIDGTLTLPRQKISDSFEEFFFNWMRGKTVFFVTGSDLKKVKEQLSQRIILNSVGIFCCMGNELYLSGERIYSNKLEMPDELVDYLKHKLETSKYPNKRGNNLEFRPGMLNFSIAGRESSIIEREEYNNWDLKTNERKEIVNYIQQNFKEKIEARIGGQISIDIQNVGNNKSLASKWLRREYAKDGKEIELLFFGDSTSPSGNDYDIVKDIVDKGDGNWYDVKDPDMLKMLLEVK